jgi:hypothetical protein
VVTVGQVVAGMVLVWRMPSSPQVERPWLV